MRERLKTAILFCLVVSSVILTGLLLFGQPPLETASPPSYERLAFGELRPVAEHIQPFLQLTTEESRQILQPWHRGHGTAWDLLLTLLAYSGTPEPSQWPEDEGLPYVSAIFPVSALPKLWVPANAAAVEFAIDQLVWFIEDPQTVWYQSSASGGWYRARLESRLPENWPSLLQEAFSAGETYLPTEADEWESIATAGTVFIPAELPSLMRYSVRPEELDTEKLLRSIFVDPALVRQIQERDGAFIYTDGQRGLRIFEHGELEFTSPNNEPGREPLDFLQALRKAAQYLQLMGGWPDNLYLQEFAAVDRVSWNSSLWDTYTLSFVSVQQNLPVYSTNSLLKLRFSDRGVIDYRRHIVMLDNPLSEPAPLLDPREAARRAAESADFSGGAIVEVYPVFFLDQAAARPVALPAWVFCMDNGRKAVIHGHTGTFLAWLE